MSLLKNSAAILNKKLRWSSTSQNNLQTETQPLTEICTSLNSAMLFASSKCTLRLGKREKLSFPLVAVISKVGFTGAHILNWGKKRTTSTGFTWQLGWPLSAWGSCLQWGVHCCTLCLLPEDPQFQHLKGEWRIHMKEGQMQKSSEQSGAAPTVPAKFSYYWVVSIENVPVAQDFCTHNGKFHYSLPMLPYPKNMLRRTGGTPRPDQIWGAHRRRGRWYSFVQVEVFVQTHSYHPSKPWLPNVIQANNVEVRN